MIELERDIERALVEMVKRHGGVCLKWVCPGWSGVPDRIVLLPGGCIHFVELKRPKGGRLSPRQEWWGQRLKELGFQHWVIWNREELAAFRNIVLEGTV